MGEDMGFGGGFGGDTPRLLPGAESTNMGFCREKSHLLALLNALGTYKR